MENYTHILVADQSLQKFTRRVPCSNHQADYQFLRTGLEIFPVVPSPNDISSLCKFTILGARTELDGVLDLCKTFLLTKASTWSIITNIYCVQELFCARLTCITHEVPESVHGNATEMFITLFNIITDKIFGDNFNEENIVHAHTSRTYCSYFSHSHHCEQ